MPRNLYPSHTGRFGGLNRQLLYARSRMRDFRRRSEYGRYGEDRDLSDIMQKMPEGVAGKEFVPEEYETSPMWADAEQRLHDILRNPPKYHRDPQTEEEKDEQYQALMANNPQLIQEQMRGETMRAVAGGKSSERVDKQNEKKFKVAATMAEGRHKVWMDMKKSNATHAGTYTQQEMDTALESRNAAYREWHKVAEEADYGDISESFPELHKSGRTKKSQEDIDKAKIKRTALSRRTDPYLNIAMGEMGLPDIAPGGIPPQKQLDALNQLGPMLDQQLADGEITAEQWKKAVAAIKTGKTAEERLEKAKEAVPEITNQVLQETTRPPAQLPQSLAGQAEGLPGSDQPGFDQPDAGMAEFPPPEKSLLGEEEEYDMAPAEGPEQYMESTPEQMSRLPQDRYDALNMKLFNRLPSREEIGKVPDRFKTRGRPKTPGKRGRYPYQKGGRKKSIVREE